MNKADVKPGYYAEFPIEWLRGDADTQARVRISRKTVEEYANAMARGDKFPPADIFWNQTDGFIGDGHHRYRGSRLAKFKTMPVFVHEGGLREAILHSCGANAGHGRNGDDKRNAVTKLLLDEEWVKWSDREIARHCKVGPTLVGEVRAQLSASGQLKKVTHRKSKDGKIRNVAAAAAATRARGKARHTSKGAKDAAPESSRGQEETLQASEGAVDADLTAHHDFQLDDAASAMPTAGLGSAPLDETLVSSVAVETGRSTPTTAPQLETEEHAPASDGQPDQATALEISELDRPSPAAQPEEVPLRTKQSVAARTRRFRTTNQVVLEKQLEIMSLIDGRPTLHIPFERIRMLAEESATAIKGVES